MTYKEAIKEQCERYARDNSVRFIGYNTVFGSRMYGTLSGVPESLCVEAPVAENLMVGLGLGMSIEGYKPVVCFERHDFLLLALDALVNQMDKMPWMSGGQFKYPVVVRAIVGSSWPIDPGPMHKQNYVFALREMFEHTPVLEIDSQKELRYAWDRVGNTSSGAVVVVEYKDLYDKEIPFD